MTLRRLLIVLTAAAGGVLGAGAQLNTDRTVEVGRSALYFEDYLLAIQHFNQVIEVKPYLPEPYLLRAIAKYNLEDFSGAEADAVKATELNPFLPNAWEVRGVANQSMGRHLAAVADYDRALELLPFNRQILFNKALAQEAARHFRDADSTYSVLLQMYPRFDPAYVGRAQLCLQQGDTVGARTNLTGALEINPNSVEALSLRAALSRDDPQAALADMEQAVKLQPDRTYLRINRAVARYLTYDFNGALNDLDYVLEQDPVNYTALFNRALLRAEIHDNDRALLDFNRALQLRPDDLNARFNRALVESEKGMWTEAIADATEIIGRYPQMYAGYALRGQIYQQAGRDHAAMADFRRANAIAHTAAASGTPEAPNADDEAMAEQTAEETINRFKTLQTIGEESASTATRTFNTRGLQGRVQEHSVQIEPQPIYQLSYYTASDAANVYDREIEELNNARVLPFVVFLTNDLPQMTRDSDIARHFESIQRLGALINSGKAKPLDRFARAMDHVTVRDYPAAIADLDALIALQPDFAPAYLMRAAARYRQRESQKGRVLLEGDINVLNAQAAMVQQQILADLELALEYNPRMAVAIYNRGVLLLQTGQEDEAFNDFTRAIEISPDLGPAYFNRGYIQFSRGNREDAIRDLSRAGQLGITAAYSLLKHLNQ